MANDAEDKVSRFYNNVGWKIENDITEDAKKWEDLRPCAREYVSKCRLRVLRHIPGKGENILDMASGPIQYQEYLEYSRNFRKRYCVDLSSEALAMAKKRIADHGVYLHGSFFDIPLEDDFFDCTVSLHTIYHIDKDKQEEAVRKLVRVTKPGRPVIIVYSNPNTFVSSLWSSLPLRLVRKAASSFKRPKTITANKNDSGPYYHPHPLVWWHRFNDVADVKFYPWRSFAASVQKKLIPDNRIGRRMFDVLFDWEDRYPDFFVQHFQYPMIVLTKIADPLLSQASQPSRYIRPR
jgi:ubiquinone/menaquinone biosynthesis C-methylase UbiE